MYKKSYLLLYILISVSNLLLLSGCLNKQQQPNPTETIAELMPEQQTATQNPALAAAANVVHLASSAQLEELTSKGNVVVDFYGPNCGPCRTVSPVIDQLAKQYAGKVNFIKVNVDKFSDLSRKFNIRGVPTFYFFNNGQKIDSFSGARDKGFFEQKIKSHFNV